MKGSRKVVFKISNIAACPLMRALRERETSADERGTAAVAGFLSGCLEMGPRAKSPGVVLVGSRQLMHCNRNTRPVDGFCVHVGSRVGVCGDLIALASQLDRKKSHPPSAFGRKALAT